MTKNSTTMQEKLSERQMLTETYCARSLLPSYVTVAQKCRIRLQPSSNISKSDSTDKQNTSNPSSHTHTLERESPKHKILSFDCICRSIGHVRERVDVCGVRRGYQVRVDGEKESGACEGDGGGEDKAGPGTVEEVPDSWVCESEGKAELKG
jgi:hypothetical protein